MKNKVKHNTGEDKWKCIQYYFRNMIKQEGKM